MSANSGFLVIVKANNTTIIVGVNELKGLVIGNDNTVLKVIKTIFQITDMILKKEFLGFKNRENQKYVPHLGGFPEKVFILELDLPTVLLKF